MTEDIETLFFSDDESEERILRALADISASDDEESESSSSYDVEDDKDCEKDHDDPSPQRQSTQPVTNDDIVAKQQKDKLSYVALPETYRAVPTSRITQPTPATPAPPLPVAAIINTTPQQAATSPAFTSSISPWVQRFLAYCHRDALLPLPLDFLMDNFNLAQLAPVVERIALAGYSQEEQRQILSSLGDENKQPYPIYRRALQLLVQQYDGGGGGGGETTERTPPFVETAARALYLLLHQRFCLSPRGLDMVRRRFLATRSDAAMTTAGGPKRLTVFGECPNPSCRNASLLPYGESDNYQLMLMATTRNATTTTTDRHERRCKRYCCSCHQAFVYRASKADGCAWGTSFCHLFVMTYGKPFLTSRKGLKQGQTGESGSTEKLKLSLYNGKLIEPTIFGFRLRPGVGSLPKGQ